MTAQAAIVGIGESRVGKVPDRSALQLQTDAAQAALTDAGLRMSDIDGLLIATGHFRSGILLTPVTARLVREWIIEQRVSVDWDRFSPLRFQTEKTDATNTMPA